MGIFASSITNALADEKTRKFEFIPSKIGMDYQTVAPSPLAEILSHGEAEWMENATPLFGEEDAKRYWAGVCLSLSDGRISKSMIGRLKRFTPNMLTKFAVGLQPSDPVFGYLWSVGNLHVATNFVGKN